MTSFLFPITLTLAEGASDVSSPGGISEVLNSLLMNIVANPVDALANANYLGILAWAVLLGIALRRAPEGVKTAIDAFSDGPVHGSCAGSSAVHHAALDCYSPPSPSRASPRS